MKRHHFRGGEGSHGSMFHRAPGSIGASSFPSRVVPGMRMGGHMGNAQVTVRNLEVVEVDTEDNVLVVKGAVPGSEWRIRAGAEVEEVTAMPTVDVVDLNNQKVGEVELADDVFGAEVNEVAAVRSGAAVSRRACAPARTTTKVRARSRGLGQEAVEAEGHGPGARGFGAVADLAPRRHGPRTATARLQLQAAARRCCWARCARRFRPRCGTAS